MNMLGDYPAVYCTYCGIDYCSKQHDRIYSNCIRVTTFKCYNCGKNFTVEQPKDVIFNE